jgi:primosomal protein N' (replication factor Y)
METRLVVDLAIDPKTVGLGGAESVFTYLTETPIPIGSAFFAPVGNRQVLGFATDCYEATEEDLGFSFESLKPLGPTIVGLELPPVVVELAKFIAAETLCPLPVALSAATPPGVRERLVDAWSLVGELPEKKKRNELRLESDIEAPVTPLQKEILRTMGDAGGTIYDKAGKRLDAAWTRALKLLKKKGLVTEEMRLLPFQERRATEQLLRLCQDNEKVEAFVKAEAKRKPAQVLTLMQLQATEDGRGALGMAEIKALAGVTDTTIKALVGQGLLVTHDPAAVPSAPAHHPNPFQKLAIDAVVESVRKGENRNFLLYGVTGSGKTEVYLRCAAEALREGRQVLYVVPEIALATQVIAKLRERFGRGVAVLHSELPAKERLQNFLRVRDGEAPVVLGARSALFAPLDHLGLIIIDEEHEASYKQENTPRYHAKALALWLGRRHNCPVVLGSATPSVESFFEAEQEKLALLTLPQRAASATLPIVHIDDLGAGYREGRPSILAEELLGRMATTLQAGNQVILFLNRRAYAPFILCRDCGHQMMCPRCAVSLSFHRRDSALRCHHCGFKTILPDRCPDCAGSRLAPLGVGTEKVEEAVALNFPDASVARLDRDIARKRGALEDVLARFRSGDIHVLVGTQMVAKGLDFPNVTLVGVVAADVSLNLPDFRAGERTFQLLSQVAGRAGRGHKPGDVVIQTFNPEHVALRTAQTHNFLDFYENLKAEREAAAYPPFRRLVNFVLSSENRTGLLGATDELARRLQAIPDGEVLGPVDCVLERLKDRWRRHILLKLPTGAPVGPIAEAVLGFQARGVQLAIDVDPYNLM